ncbi:hypothetical protein M9458_056081, partial [Cirrhinus mrigala]
MAFMDGSCPHCERMSMAALRLRLSCSKRLPSAPSRPGTSGSTSSAATLVRKKGNLTVTVRNAPTGQPPRWSDSSHCPVEMPSEGGGSSRDKPSVSFGAPEEDRMSIAASEEGLTPDEESTEQLADSSSLARSVVRAQGPGASASQSFGAPGHLGEEQALPCAEHLFSRDGAGFGQDDARLSEFNQTQYSGSSKDLSEAPGAYGSCSRGYPTRLASYETASALAPWPDPKMGMAPRRVPGRRYPRILPSFQPVVRPDVPMGRGAPGTGSEARDCQHGCLQHRLGCCMQRARSLGLLDRTSTAVAYKLPQVAGRVPRASSVPLDVARGTCAGLHGQHGDGRLYQPPRGFAFPLHVATHPSPPPLESEVAQIATWRSYSGGAELCSRCALTPAYSFWRMETPSPGGPADLEPIWGSSDRSVCFSRIRPLPVVLFPDRGSPRPGTQLAPGTNQVCLSPSEPPCTDPVQDPGGRGAGLAGCALLAHPDLVRGTHAPRDSPSLEDSPEEGPSFSGDGHHLAPVPRSMEPSCLGSGRDAADLSGLPQALINTITQARAPSTRQAYALRWGLFIDWCSSRHEDPQRCSIGVLCPVRALRIYVDHTRSFRRSEQLFVCFGGQQKGNAVSKQRLAHWVVDAITLAYQCQGESCPLGVRTHSTRSVASSWALAHSTSLADICRAVGWAKPNTFVRFYNLCVEPVSSRVL